MGFDLLGEGYQLHAFARFVEETGHAGPLTTELLLRWVQAAKKPGPVTASRRVEVLRPFLKYCRQFDPACPVLPLGLCGPAHRRISPHIYTEAEITELLAAARELKPDGMRPLTSVSYTHLDVYKRQGHIGLLWNTLFLGQHLTVITCE